MKKLTVALALILCLVLCVFAFASCKKKNGKTGTTADVSVPATTAVPDATTGERVTSAPHVHVPGDWEIITDPTCSTDGEKVKYCEECGALIEGSEAIIPSVPDAHVVDDWNIVEPTLLDPVGSKTGVCKYCKKDLDYVLNWEINPYSSVEKTGKYADNNDFRFHKSIEDIRGEDHFYPTDENPDGNDLWFEYSLLWNETLYNRDTPKNLSEIRLFGFRESTAWSNYRGFYYLYLLNDDSQGGAFHTSSDCPFQGHIDYSTYLLEWSGWSDEEAYKCADDLTDLGNTLNGDPIGQYKAGWAYCHPGGVTKACSPYLWDSEKQTMGGWHRLGFRYHQEAEISGTEVLYSGYTELYIDGVLCWRVHSNFSKTHKDSLVVHNLLLWTATIDEEDPTKLNYTDHDSMMVEMRLDSVGNSSKEVLVAVDDVQWTCGTGFVTPVVRVENPKPVTIELAEGIEDDGAMYYAKPGCVHEAEAEWTVVKEATAIEDGLKAKFCAKCGERMETEAIAYEAPLP